MRSIISSCASFAVVTWILAVSVWQTAAEQPSSVQRIPPVSADDRTGGAAGSPVTRVGYSAADGFNGGEGRAIEPLPGSASATTRRIAELEQRLAEVESRTVGQTVTGSVAPLPAPGPETVVGADVALIPKWNFGFEAETKDKVFRTKFGGQLQFDYTDYNQASQLTNTPINAPPGSPAGGIGRQNESVNFRRLRLRSEGTMYENVGWVVQPDFANAANVSNVPGNPPGFPNSLGQAGFPVGQTLAIVPSLTDCYVTVMKLPVMNNLRIGNFKEPMGLEHMTSSRFLDFMDAAISRI